MSVVQPPPRLVVFFDLDRTIVRSDVNEAGIVAGMAATLSALNDLGIYRHILTNRIGLPVRPSSAELNLLERFFTGHAIISGDGVYDVTVLLDAVQHLRGDIITREQQTAPDNSALYNDFKRAISYSRVHAISIDDPSNKAYLLLAAKDVLYASSRYMPDGAHAIALVGDAFDYIDEEQCSGAILPFAFVNPADIHNTVTEIHTMCPLWCV